MAGLGRRTHYRKHLTDSIIYDFPEPGENECIAKVVATRGGNQFDIILSSESQTQKGNSDDDKEDSDQQQRESHLAILPTKFNKLVWVKRNDFVIVETAVDDNDNNDDGTAPNANANKNEYADTGSIRYIISHILYKDQVKHLQSKGMWPTKDAEFAMDKIGLRDADDNEATEEGNNNEAAEAGEDGIVYDQGYEDDDIYLVNTNRVAALKVDDSSDSEESE